MFGNVGSSVKRTMQAWMEGIEIEPKVVEFIRISFA